MELSEQGKAILLASDDQGFCELLLHMAHVGDSIEYCLETLCQPWALERLQHIRIHNARIFYLRLMTPLRRLYPREIFPQDLFAAMEHMAWESSGAGGDVGPAPFIAAGKEFYEQGGKPGASPGWYTLGKHYTVRRGELTVVTGIASHMKTTFVQALCVNLARQEGWHFGLFSPEQYPLGNLARWLVETYRDEYIGDMPEEMFDDSMGWVSQHFFPIVPPEDAAPTLPWILGVARQQVQQYGLSGLVIDPWNEVDHLVGNRQSETNYVSEALSKLRRFAHVSNVHVWVVAHPRKMQKALSGPYKDKYPPPSPYDISDSAHWYNKADNCLCVWRNVGEDSHKIQIHVQKVRNRSVGRPGVVELTLERGRFHEGAVPAVMAKEMSRYGQNGA